MNRTILSLALLLTIASPISAADRNWVGPDGGLYHDFKNWTPSGSPTGPDTTFIDWTFGGTLDILFATNPSHSRFVLHRGVVEFDLAGHTLNTNTALGSSVIVGDTGGFTPCTLRLNVGTLAGVNGAIATATSSIGNVLVLESSHWTNSGQLTVGSGGAGSLSILGPDGSATVTSNGATIAQFNTSNSSALVEGTFASWTNIGDMRIGDAGNGTLTVSNFASVDNSAATFIADDAGSVGLLRVRDPISQFDSGFMRIGNGGNGMMIVELGGAVTCGPSAVIGFAAGSVGEAIISGSTSEWTCTGPGVVTVGSAGQGTLSLVSEGSLTATNSVGVGNDGLIRGTGTITSPVVNNGLGVVAPGLTGASAVGRLTFSGGYLQGSGAQISFNLAGTALTSFDRLIVGGSAGSVAFPLSGTLSVSLVGGFVPAIGSSFAVITAASVNAAFTDFNLPPLPSDRMFLITYTPTNVIVRVVLMGDLNGDGVVNSLDLGILLSSWSIPAGAPGCGGAVPCAADLNGDGVVNSLDLGILLSNWTM